MAVLTAGATALDTDQINLTRLQYGVVDTADAGHIRVVYTDGSTDDLYGAFTYDSTGSLSGGTLTEAKESKGAALVLDLSALALPVQTFVGYVQSGDGTGLLSNILSGADTLGGSPAADLIRGYAGDDTFRVSGGTDTLDGGSGANSVVFTGAYSSYGVVSTGVGAWTVTDQRPGAPDGVVTLTNIQALAFLDGTLDRTPLPDNATVAAIDATFGNVGRAGVLTTLPQTATIQLADGTTVTNPYYTLRLGLLDLASQVTGGTLSLAAAERQLEHGFDSTTSVATLSYQFFTGKTPTSAGYDYLVNSASNPNDLNDPYYAKFSEENRYINFAVNLGKFGEGAASFQANYGALNLTQALEKAYLDIFGFAADDAKAAAILNAPESLPGIATRADYFAYYGGDGPNGIGTKAAMVGYLLVEAVKADLGTDALANDAFLDALAGGSAQYNVDLKAVYGAHGAPLVGVSGDGAAW